MEDDMLRPVEWNPWVRGLGGAAMGGILAFAVYHAVRLPRVGLILVLGAFAGFLLAAVLPRYFRTLRLAGIAINVPQVGRVNFAVTKGSQYVAWQLFVEGM